MASVPSGSFGHRIAYWGGDYELGWYYYRRLSGTLLLSTVTNRRFTDRKGALRFAKKWGVKMPEEEGRSCKAWDCTCD